MLFAWIFQHLFNIEHNLKSKQWIGLKICTHVFNKLMLNLKKCQLDNTKISKVIKKKPRIGLKAITSRPFFIKQTLSTQTFQLF